jgi:hypothetical protein
MKITPESIQRMLEQQPGVWWTRLMIASEHGKRKTTHVINTIRRAVEEQRIIETDGFDSYNMPCKVYRSAYIDKSVSDYDPEAEFVEYKRETEID